MRSAGIHHLVASQHSPLGELQRPGKWREGSSRTTAGYLRYTRKE